MSPRSIAGVPLSQAIDGYPITVHHSYAFSTSWEAYWCGTFTNRQTNKLEVCRTPKYTTSDTNTIGSPCLLWACRSIRAGTSTEHLITAHHSYVFLLGGLALWRILLGPFVTETCKEQQIESRHVTLCHISRSV